ncbi:MAG: Protease Do [Candidatus Berkelbacteria bacterium Athens1014_28]|uniref:Protease Do n=1 Tax=Candidatus Berkelbacteria bacterium Athens1014_28 TaxID=2017145 RepID=A0A554LM66_9BACT|nr:MAG: Protease Do [Candidatus Berkelbacteria bacterium Athens1014_28]
MPKVEFVNSDSDDKSPNTTRRKSKKILFLCATIVISLVFGAVAGIGGVIIISNDNGKIAKKLGFLNWNNLSIPLTETKKVKLEESSAIIDAVNKVSPAVVSIVSKSKVQNIFGNVIEQEGDGTGFIITSDGLILTNKHVVSDTSASYTVITSDGKNYDAKIQSSDPLNDLAVIKIDARNLPVVDLGNSDDLVVGQWVVAIGNALGQFQNTVTVGVISAKQRDIQASDSSGGSKESLQGMLQTDTAINAGNSGGPLVNTAGQVVGINTAVASGAQGIGFAIPINSAKKAIDSIKKTGQIIRPYLGIRYLPITPDLQKTNNLAYSYGVIVVRGNGLAEVAVVPGSPADKAGIVENDIILEINGERIDSQNGLSSLLQKYNVGDTVTLKISHKDEEKSVKVTLGEIK